MLGPLVQAEVRYRVDRILGVKRTVIFTPGESKPAPGVSNGEPTSQVSNNGSTPGVSDTLTPGESRPTPGESGGGPVNFSGVQASENNIIPVSTEYGIVIEKINANAKIIPDVNPAHEREYVAALTQGVAAALGSTPPGQKGNLYLFSHSTDAPWNIVRVNAIFYLLRELVPGDKVIIFYKNKRYDYIVFDKNIVNPNDVSYLTNKYDTPILTLQTCDPPGTLLNRLIVRAKLVSS